MTQPHPTPHVPQYRPWKVAVPLPGDADLSPETKELLSSLLRHARSSLHGSRLFATSVCLRNDLSPIEPKETPLRWTLKALCTS